MCVVGARSLLVKCGSSGGCLQQCQYYKSGIVIGVRDGGGRGGGGGAVAPPQFGQFVDINSGREWRLFWQNTIHV